MALPPDQAALREAAVAHLARYAATEAGLLRVLRRRVQRWAAAERAANADAETIAEQTAAALAGARQVVQRLAAAKTIDDAAFAVSRAARLSRSGRSRRVIAAHLAARGVAAATVDEALSLGSLDEFVAAIAFARRRRIGPFRPEAESGGEIEAMARTRDRSALARAGFPRSVADRVLAITREAAEEADLARRRAL